MLLSFLFYYRFFKIDIFTIRAFAFLSLTPNTINQQLFGSDFMSSLEALTEKAAQFVWGPALLLLVLFGGAFFTVASGFYPLRKLRFIIKSTFGSLKGKSGGFAAMATALGATAGTGNIVGVASAIAIGGAGAVFWMWVGAFLGMMLKFAEAAMAVKYRGGAMKYIERAFGGRKAAVAWCICCICLVRNGQYGTDKRRRKHLQKRLRRTARFCRHSHCPAFSRRALSRSKGGNKGFLALCSFNGGVLYARLHSAAFYMQK